MKDFSMLGILHELQRIQAENFGKREISVSVFKEYLSISICEEEYKSFPFWSWDDDYGREAQWKRFMDCYNG